MISRASDQRVDAGFSALAAKARKAVIGAGGGAFCVHLEGRCVVDIWAGERDPASGSVWERDTMAMAWSTTKGVASTALHMLVDQGLLGYNDTVATFWPEFAAAGKGSTTIRQVMAMEAGLYDVRHLVADPRLLMDHEVMATALAAASPRHRPGAANAYHAFTYGWIIGELASALSCRRHRASRWPNWLRRCTRRSMHDASELAATGVCAQPEYRRAAATGGCRVEFMTDPERIRISDADRERSSLVFDRDPDSEIDVKQADRRGLDES